MNRRRKDPVRQMRRQPQRAVLLPEFNAVSCSVQLLGRNCAMVENHLGLIRLGTECVAVKTRDGVLQVNGTGLVLTEVRPDALVVQGKICRVQYPENGNA